MKHDVKERICLVCMGCSDYETLTTDCCGRILLPYEMYQINRGNFDYIEARGGWVELLLDSEAEDS